MPIYQFNIYNRDVFFFMFFFFIKSKIRNNNCLASSFLFVEKKYISIFVQINLDLGLLTIMMLGNNRPPLPPTKMATHVNNQ